ncbi:MAG TPA: hypothetical protein VM843_05820, partial [Flavisolibacter sp.]|nr:hypothetical protein [Flavisolibacter sp.]
GLRNFLFFLFLIECMHGAYFTTKQVLHTKEVLAAKSVSSPVKKITKSILAISSNGEDLHLVTSDQQLRRYASLYDIQVYVLLNAPCTAAALPTGNYVFATHSEDSLLLQSCFSGQPFNQLEPIFPFVLNAYKRE